MRNRVTIVVSGLLLAIAAGFAAYSYFGARPTDEPSVSAASNKSESAPEYLGQSACVGCHAEENNDWMGSHHDLAMQLPDAETVLADFDNSSFEYNGITSTFFTRDGAFYINTDGPDGTLQDYEVEYVFGVEPLQQYLLELPGGRLQALSIAWDTRPAEQGGQRWFHLYPEEKISFDDELHWTTVNQNWNYMCAECHSTNLQKNYSVETNSYATSYSEIDVSCEACHGPGSKHVDLANEPGSNELAQRDDKGFAKDFSPALARSWQYAGDAQIASLSGERDTNPLIETCAQCHSRRTTIDASAVHRETFYDSHLPALLEPGLYHADGQIDGEVYVYGSFLQSKMYAAGVSCIDCHDAHSLELKATGNHLCAQCHQPQVYDVEAHHLHEPESAGSQCVACHMPAKNFMVVDPRRDHSFRVPRPDLSISTGAPNACSQCHTDQPPEWAVETIKKAYGRDTFAAHYGDAIHAGWNQAANAKALLQELARDDQQPVIARATATALLGNYPVNESIYTIRAGLGSADPLLRIAALETLGGIEIDERYSLAGRLLADPVRSVRMTAAGLLAGADRAGFTAQQQSEFNAAVEEYIEVQYENAGRGFAHNNLGTLYLALGETARAEAEYKLAVEIEPQFFASYVNLADFYRQSGNEERAEAVLREAIKINPDIGAVNHALGLSRARQQDFAGALEYLGRAAELDTDNSQFRYVYAIALNSAGEPAAALEVLDAAHERWPGNRQFLMTLMTLNAETGDIASSLRYGNRLQELVPDDPSVQQYLQQLGQQ